MSRPTSRPAPPKFLVIGYCDHLWLCPRIDCCITHTLCIDHHNHPQLEVAAAATARAWDFFWAAGVLGAGRRHALHFNDNHTTTIMSARSE
jgi:hypothetical protein